MLAVDAQCLSWPTENRHWMGRAFWYWCIVLDVFSIGISSQQLSILQYIQACNLDHSPLLGMIVKENSEGKYPDSNMVYVWECPMMLLVHSMVFFIVAVSVHVCYPLISDPGFGVDSKVSDLSPTERDSYWWCMLRLQVYILQYWRLTCSIFYIAPTGYTGDCLYCETVICGLVCHDVWTLRFWILLMVEKNTQGTGEWGKKRTGKRGSKRWG